MKSIMEEASSISKAIDQAWNRAGRPSDFSVKVFEESKRNMFGLTTRPAKIALFFDEKSVALPVIQEKKQPGFKKESPVQHQKPSAPSRPYKGTWAPEMVDFIKEWVSQTLHIMGLGNIQFSVSTSGNLIKFNFKSSITGKETNDRLLFSSIAHLVMTALRQKYKKPLQNLKIVLTCG